MRLIAVICFSFLRSAYSRNDDLFNYRETDGNDYGPEDWDQVTCDDVTVCTGWPDDWQLGVGWELKKNSCEWCPEGSKRCGTHHQSPIDLERNRAIEGDPMYNRCIDLHWMKYEDSACSWNDLTTKNAFSIERHALKVTQPLEYGNGGDEGIRLDCTLGGDDGRRFGRIDFSKGFHDWWFLSHIDFKVPSEHTQEGKRYSAEVQMAHFYSISGEDAGVDNEMATVSIFLNAYDDALPYPHLDRLICEWRKVEDKTREECGLPSVAPYPGCYNVARGHTSFPSEAPVTLSSAPIAPTAAPLPTEPTIPPVVIPGAPTPPPMEPTAAPVASKAPNSPLPTEAPSLAPTSKPPPTPFPTVPTTPDPAALVTFAPLAGAPVFSPVAGNSTVPGSAPFTGAPARANATEAPMTPTTKAPIPGSTEVPVAGTPTNSTNTPTPGSIGITLVPTRSPSAGTATNSTNIPSAGSATNLTKAPSRGTATNSTNIPSDGSTGNATVPTTVRTSQPTTRSTRGPTTATTPAPTTATTPVPTKRITPAPTKGTTPKPNNGTSSAPTRKGSPAPTTRAVRNLRTSVKDVITDNYKLQNDFKKRITLEAENFRPPDRSEEDWAAWVEGLSLQDGGEASDEQRKLLGGDFLSFHNYQFLIDVRTEYYFRYSGTSTVPPCYGPFVGGSRGTTNHWRVLKDPIRVHPRQIAEMERLLRERIAPTDDSTKACENDTAGKVDSDGHISVARPLMQFHYTHFKTFCECDNWESKWPEDREWCRLNQSDKLFRFYDHPYNYDEGESL